MSNTRRVAPYGLSPKAGHTLVAIAFAGLFAACASSPPGGHAAAKPVKPSKAAVAEAEAIVAGKEACGPIGVRFADEKWRAQLQRGVWRVWVKPLHCGVDVCPTYEVHVTAADGVASGCVQRISTE